MHRTLRLLTPKGYEIARPNTRWYAGHSKWANIKHIKAEKDGERAATFARIRRAMEVAVKEKGSADPKENYLLAQAVDQAKKANMPSATVQNILKSLQDKKKAETHVLEIKGPKGCAFIVCVKTDNAQIVKQNINTILRKSNGAFSYGTLLHQFTQKGIIRADFLPGTSLEDAIDHALEIYLDDVEEKVDGERYLEFMCAPKELEKKKTQLESLNYVVRSAEIEYSPIATVSVQEDVIQLVDWLYEKLRSIPDVVDIHNNIAKH